MSFREADVFAPRRDADWEMFCRGATQAGAAVSLEPEEERPSGGGRVSHFHTRLVGVPYPNADGTNRRDAVRDLKAWERVRLAHRPDNPVDANAVAVLRQSDERQLGYLPAAVAAGVVAEARRGTRYLALVSEITGTAEDDVLDVGGPPRAGLLILVLAGGANKVMARKYFLQLRGRRYSG